MKNLLVAVDFSNVTDRVVATAEELARTLDAKVWVLHCVREFATYAPLEVAPLELPTSDVLASERYPELHHKLMAIVSALKEKGVDAEALLTVGSPTEEIAYLADQHQAELIIMGSHGHGAFYDLVAGSVTQEVLRRTSHLTLIVPSEPQKRPEKLSKPVQWEEPMATPY